MSWLKRLFGPKQVDRQPPVRFRSFPPSDQWKPGDLGKCTVKPGPRGFYWQTPYGDPVPGPKPGDTVKVMAVFVRPVEFPGSLFLAVSGWAPQVYCASCFRKLDEQGDKAAWEVTRKLNAPIKRRELTNV